MDPCDQFSSRRNFLAGAAGALLCGTRLGGQNGRPRRINVHHHLTAPAYVKFLVDNKVRQFPIKSAAESIEDMDKAGINIALCSTIGPGFWHGDPGETRRIAREINEYAAKVVSDYPGRFGAFASLPLPDIDASLKEAEYALDTLKADGIYLYTNWGGKSLYGDKYLGDPALAPLYEELNRRKAVVYTHPKEAACCEALIPGMNPATIEYPIDTARTITSLLYTGTAAKYPDVKFIFSHGGGALTGIIGRIAGASATYLQEGGKLRAGAPAPRATPAMPKGPLFELQKFYYDTSSAVNPVGVGGLRKIVPLSQILFGGDFPFVVTAEQVELLNECGVFNEQELRAIYSENVGKLLPRYRA
ncbi:MAG TPA: amidohydrolase family protein [Bryobacteraceae bacterium]|nr:amidohydrolase family protein [Bryobacteraceae bacterium]